MYNVASFVHRINMNQIPLVFNRVFHKIIYNHSIHNMYSDFKTQEINSQGQKVSKLQSNILVEKRVIKLL